MRLTEETEEYDPVVIRFKKIAKRALALLVLAAMAVCLAACKGISYGEVDNSAKYGAQTEFEGPGHEVSVFFVNVGKADCAIVKVDGHAWLVDTGTEESFVNTVSALRLMGVASLDGVILTHEHDDHIGGLEPLSRLFPVGRVITPAFLNDRRPIETILYDAELPEEPVRAGDTVTITDGVEFGVLAPSSLYDGDDNDNSLVAMLEVNGRRFLFTGDMQKAEDKILTESGADITCDVLKAPNHANNDSCSEAFCKAASPLITVISTDTSVDANSASRLVMARLSGSEFYVTQKYSLGVRVDVSAKGEISLSFPENTAPAAQNIEITEASKTHQSFTIRNNGTAALDLTGWFVYSTKGCEVFAFPAGCVIEPGQEMIVACRKSDLASTADLVWDKKKVWADNKADNAVLCDSAGNEISRLTSR